jgi:hypothetical protein
LAGVRIESTPGTAIEDVPAEEAHRVPAFPSRSEVPGQYLQQHTNYAAEADIHPKNADA